MDVAELKSPTINPSTARGDDGGRLGEVGIGAGLIRVTAKKGNFRGASTFLKFMVQLDLKQIKNLPIDLHDSPLDYKIPAYLCTALYECSGVWVGWSPGAVTDDHAIGNMGSGAWMIFQALFIPEEKEYDIEVRYACGHTNVTEIQFELYCLESADTSPLAMPITSGWGDYQSIFSTLTLKKGFNHIRLKRDDNSESANIDFLRIFES